MHKEAVIIAAVLFFTVSVWPDTARCEVEKRYYSNGRVHRVIPYVDGRKHGEMKVYSKDGNLTQKIKFKDDEKKFVRYFHKNGVVSREVPYVDGKPNGTMHVYDENGDLVQKIPYRNGEIEGVAEQYYVGGALYTEKPYKNGVPTGTQKFYDRKGNLVEEVEL